MGVTVFVERRSVAHKDAGGQAIGAAPDVCKTPSPGGPVPIPYVNIASDADTSQGSKTVTADGNPIMLKDSEFAVSSGDEPGTAGGVGSSVNKGKAKFSVYSFRVKAEGKNIPRHLDMMLMNGNSPNLMGVYRGFGKVPGHWDMECVLKILCTKDPGLVKELNKLKKLKTFDEVFWMDPYYDGTKWTKRKFSGGGYNSKADREIGLVTEGTCEDGAVTVKHELIHQSQPDMLSADAEDDAYRTAEEWAIKNGLPTQAPDYNFRTPGPGGTETVNFSEVQRMVRDNYPVPAATSGPPPPQCIGKNASGLSIMQDPTTGAKSVRPPKKGDSFSGPETKKGEKKIDPKSLKCP